MRKLSGCSRQLPSPAARCAPLWAWPSPSLAKVHLSASDLARTLIQHFSINRGSRLW